MQTNLQLAKINLREFGLFYNLRFDEKYKYCLSGPYKNELGQTIPTVFYWRNKYYQLKYVSGCFHRFLNEIIEPSKSQISLGDISYNRALGI